MKQIQDFSDSRYKGSCVHCGAALSRKPTNDDHVPTKSLLDRPLPANVHVLETCVDCNSGFSADEEYFVAFLGSAMSGSTSPEAQVFESARKVLTGNARLQREIELAKVEAVDSDGVRRLKWNPELERIRRVVVKNARGHVFHELGRPMHDEPDEVMVVPLELIEEERLADFLTAGMGGVWPEVGSRLFQRLFEGIDMAAGWIIVQPEIYVFAIIESDGVTVRSIIREYLLTEVTWRD
jgi:hypothetical protein